jgi:probable H4MPT-linked C1 transfer pathway protein
LTNNNATLGWDIGGAHLKAVLVQLDGRAVQAIQRPCPLWRGMDQLQQAVADVLAELSWTPARHAITMTGELADIFPDRRTGVALLAQHMDDWLKGADTVIYAGPEGFLSAEAAATFTEAIASANWYASAEYLARRCSPAIFIDVGSTTSDLIVLHAGKPAARGYSDASRMQYDELVYTGVIRTPVMAVAQQLPFGGEWQRLAAEHFATMADVYRLTGELSQEYDMGETADGQGKSEQESARRLARMVGRDLADADIGHWRQLAHAVRSQQLRTLQSAVERQLSLHTLLHDAPFIGAGAGTFLVRELARIMNRPFVKASHWIDGDSSVTEWAGVCLPAYAVAWLRAKELA